MGYSYVVVSMYGDSSSLRVQHGAYVEEIFCIEMGRMYKRMGLARDSRVHAPPLRGENEEQAGDSGI
jgi:hypothetical protein